MNREWIAGSALPCAAPSPLSDLLEPVCPQGVVPDPLDVPDPELPEGPLPVVPVVPVLDEPEVLPLFELPERCEPLCCVVGCERFMLGLG